MTTCEPERGAACHPVAAAEIQASATLRLLALALAPPRPETVAEVAALASALADVPGGHPELGELAEAAAAGHEGVAVAHERLFGPGGLSPYEASVEVDPFRQARQMADAAGFYGAFGAVVHGPVAERPDHAGAQLEFLSFLTLRRVEAAQAGEADESARCAEIEAAFLVEHAGRWLPRFFRALVDGAADPFHRAVGRLGTVTVNGELARRGLVVEPVEPLRGRRLSVEADELECGAAGLQSPFEAVANPHRAPRRRGVTPEARG